MSGDLSAVLSPRVVPWLAILGLCLLKPNRRGQVWSVWLPLLVTAGMALGLLHCTWPDEEIREMIQFMLKAMGFGWAGTLLLAPWAPWPRKLGRFVCLLLGLGVFGLLGLALGHEWERGMFDGIQEIVCAVVLQFVVFALAAALSFAGWSARQRFSLPRLVGWFLFWLIVVWLALVIPCVTLTSFGGSELVVAVLILAGCCFLVSFVATLPFLLLGAVNHLYRKRLQQLVMPPQPIGPGHPQNPELEGDGPFLEC